jgi:hypothetical protein
VILHRHITQTLEVTNYVVIMERQGLPTIKIPFSELDSVQVLNSHSIGSSTHQTIGVGYYSRVYMGQSQHQSSTVGDILFFKGGNCVLRFNYVSDPFSLMRLCNQEIKQQKNVSIGMQNLFQN